MPLCPSVSKRFGVDATLDRMTSDAIKQRLSLFQNSSSSAGSNSEDSLRHRFLRPREGGTLADIKSQPSLFGGGCRAAHCAGFIPREQAHLRRDLG